MSLSEACQIMYYVPLTFIFLERIVDKSAMGANSNSIYKRHELEEEFLEFVLEMARDWGKSHKCLRMHMRMCSRCQTRGGKEQLRGLT